MLPLLALLVMGLVDFGRVFAQYIGAANAAREGARYCSLDQFRNATAAQLTARVVSSGTTPNTAELGGRYPAADVTLRAWKASNPTPVAFCPGAAEGEDVYVRVTILFRPITPIVGRFFPQNPLPVGGTAMFVAQPD